VTPSPSWPNGNPTKRRHTREQNKKRANDQKNKASPDRATKAKPTVFDPDDLWKDGENPQSRKGPESACDQGSVVCPSIQPDNGPLGTMCSPVDPDAAGAVATKSDDVDIPKWMWDDRIQRREATAKEAEILEWFRGRVLRIWRRKTTVDLGKFLGKDTPVVPSRPVMWSQIKGCYQGNFSGRRNYRCWWKMRPRHKCRSHEVGRDIVERIVQASWWEWLGGSTLFFWR
jgi:hypothetical protein